MQYVDFIHRRVQVDNVKTSSNGQPAPADIISDFNSDS